MNSTITWVVGIAVVVLGGAGLYAVLATGPDAMRDDKKTESAMMNTVPGAMQESSTTDSAMHEDEMMGVSNATQSDADRMMAGSAR